VSIEQLAVVTSFEPPQKRFDRPVTPVAVIPLWSTSSGTK
jgi:hypothetical protein